MVWQEAIGRGLRVEESMATGGGARCPIGTDAAGANRRGPVGSFRGRGGRGRIGGPESIVLDADYLFPTSYVGFLFLLSTVNPLLPLLPSPLALPQFHSS